MEMRVYQTAQISTSLSIRLAHVSSGKKSDAYAAVVTNPGSSVAADCAICLPSHLHYKMYLNMDDQTAFEIALQEAKLSYEEGGIPVLSIDLSQ